MSEPRHEPGTYRTPEGGIEIVVDLDESTSYVRDMFPDEVARIEAEALPTVERLAAVRRYVAGNCAIWGDDPADLLGLAIADVYQKILNVIDAGSPMPPASSEAERMCEEPDCVARPHRLVVQSHEWPVDER